MFRLGLIVNPDAGLGGKLGLKGSDGQAEIARSLGASDRSGPRLELFLNHFLNLYRGKFEDISWITSKGRMGTDWIPLGANIGSIIEVHESSGDTTFNDTQNAVKDVIKNGIDLLIYAGGDGTTRDIMAELDKLGCPKKPVIGVPTGVKMYSGSFAASPKAAAEVLSAWMRGDLLVASTEVLDLVSERVSVTGFVEDVTPYFDLAKVFISPLRYGAGMKGKIGQSMSLGLPVVTTSVGAEGLFLINGKNALIADEPLEIANSIVTLIKDKNKWSHLSNEGMKSMQKFCPEIVSKAIAKLLQL